MAKVKTAVQRITDFLRAKGLDAAEIQDAFTELNAADADLDKVAELADKNNQWVTWYQNMQPALQEIISERDTLKERISKLKGAGLTFETAEEIAKESLKQPVVQFDHTKFQTDITRATNDIMKNVAKYGLKHFKDFNEELDYDEVEKLMGEKNIPFDVAYGLYSQPKREAREKDEYDKKLKLGIQEGIQAELSKQGIRKTRKRTDDVEPARLDQPAPPDADLKAAFLRDLEEADVTH